ncbi:MAG: hypothetical protein HWN81_19500 [Candidatus Lokiarchaeota archaeon]|nr:hypothetical protein [Candidatus Lokiarchaeota archaeon]
MTDTIFSLFGATTPPSLIWLHISLFLIFTFGIGYIIVSRDLSKNHGIVMIGAMVKTEFFVITLAYFIIGDMNFMIVVLGGIDILFVCLFIEFLLKYKKL